MAAEGTSRRRILDYLNDGEEFGLEGPSSAAAATTPRALAAARSLLPRFRWARLARLGRKARADGKGKGQEIVAAAEEEGVRVLRDASASSAARAAAVGGEATRPSGLSVGLGLLFLLAKTSDEFNKMAGVRAEMEALIRDFKGQHAMATANAGGEDDVPGDRNPDSAASSCLTDGNEPRAATGRCEDHRRRHHHQVAEMEAASRRRMDVLEEEFHAELERVRAGYGADTPPFSIGEERGEGGAEPSDDDDDDDIADCREGFESDLGDDDDDGHHDDDRDEEEEEDDDDADRYGVSALELERRLHELLHQRNQERIEELEAALRRAEKRLFDKEMEASLWKDTAKMAFRHDHDSGSDSP
ncbi:protein POLAR LOCALIZATION DURING ASYMMETRIC DIVISION AND REDISTRIBUTION-like [Hordeum vulgare]|nr:protein POLAR LOCALIZATION DURING ASYMMETRIC DIVISION AND REDISTRIBUTION-like [Hordeum vulgare]